jgi:23S rRNA pseudouridine955/2504/2580 synthase
MTALRQVEAVTVGGDEAGMRLDRWFKLHYPGLGFGHLQKLLRSGQIRVDGGRVKAATRLAPGQSVRVPPLETIDSAPAPRPRQVAGDDAAFLRDILLYEDDAVLVFNKPAGLAVQGGSGMTRHIDGMLAALTDRNGVKPRLVHRLDRETAGVLIAARTRAAAATLAKTFRSRSARKIYWALVSGVPRPAQGRISTFLKRDDGEEQMRLAAHGEDDARHAVTHYSVVDRAGDRLAWLSLKPVTGRTHQLRVHLASIGHPIVGDARYRDADAAPLPGGLQNRLHLLARRLVVPHPSGRGTIDATAPLPPHMLQSWNLVGFDPYDDRAAAELLSEG